MRSLKLKGAVILLIGLLASCKKDANTTVAPTVSLSEGKAGIISETGYVNQHQTTVVNLGYGGYKASDLITKESDVFSQYPDLVILMCGTNNVIHTNDDNFHDDLSQLIDDLKKTNTDVMLLTPPPLADNSLNLLITNNICPVIKNLSIEKHCLFVDINTIFSAIPNYPLYLLDGIHPDAQGYTTISLNIFKAYAANKLSKYKIVCFGDSITYGAYVNGEGTTSGDTYPAQLSFLLN